MDIHKNARLTPQSRALLVDRVLADGWTVAEASHAAGVSERTGWKWLARFAIPFAALLNDNGYSNLTCTSTIITACTPLSQPSADLSANPE